jgi:hypothetical protein
MAQRNRDVWPLPDRTEVTVDREENAGYPARLVAGEIDGTIGDIVAMLAH